jgi:3-deoxy-manno-octulosonate cytidylyltransferase (CMP-KDO synthetase)
VPPSILGVIPARYASTRFPGKPLAILAGKPLIQHVWERASQSKYLPRLVVATDDARIESAARAFGAEVVMTRSDHLSGTDRVAEAAESTDANIIVNIQGDEPLIDPDAIDAAILTLLDDAQCQMASLKRRITDDSEIQNPNVVKVVTGGNGDALYFSRSPIPFQRGPSAGYFKHIGLYIYRRKLLLAYSSLPVGPLEQAEKLEQLRALENGIPIRVAETSYDTIGVDTPEDLAAVERIFASSSLLSQPHNNDG